jgi:N-acyl-D-amino-acid deacylase
MLANLTIGPARLMEQANASFRLRGRLKVGCLADITIFDYDEIDGAGTVLDRAVPSRGIHAVLVNGRVVYQGGELLGETPGRFLLRTRL